MRTQPFIGPNGAFPFWGIKWKLTVGSADGTTTWTLGESESQLRIVFEANSRFGGSFWDATIRIYNIDPDILGSTSVTPR